MYHHRKCVQSKVDVRHILNGELNLEFLSRKLHLVHMLRKSTTWKSLMKLLERYVSLDLNLDDFSSRFLSGEHTRKWFPSVVLQISCSPIHPSNYKNIPCESVQYFYRAALALQKMYILTVYFLSKLPS